MNRLVIVLCAMSTNVAGNADENDWKRWYGDAEELMVKRSGATCLYSLLYHLCLCEIH